MLCKSPLGGHSLLYGLLKLATLDQTPPVIELWSKRLPRSTSGHIVKNVADGNGRNVHTKASNKTCVSGSCLAGLACLSKAPVRVTMHDS